MNVYLQTGVCQGDRERVTGDRWWSSQAAATAAPCRKESGGRIFTCPPSPVTCPLEQNLRRELVRPRAEHRARREVAADDVRAHGVQLRRRAGADEVVL